MSRNAFLELLDKGVDESMKKELDDVVKGMIVRIGEDMEGKVEGLRGVRNIRGVKAGGESVIDSNGLKFLSSSNSILFLLNDVVQVEAL